MMGGGEEKADEIKRQWASPGKGTYNATVTKTIIRSIIMEFKNPSFNMEEKNLTG